MPVRALVSTAVFALAGVVWGQSLDCPPNAMTILVPGACVTTVPYGDPVVSGGVLPATCDPPKDFLFPIGTTEVSCSSFDPGPPIEFFSCSFTSTVKELLPTPPNLVCPANMRKGTAPGRCDLRVEFAPVVDDNCPGVTLMQTFGLESGRDYPIGVTGNGFTATDAAGTMKSCEFTVEVRDEEPPQITCPGDIALAQPGPASYDVPATDNCEYVEVSIDVPSGSHFDEGTTRVTATARDGDHNVATCAFDVTVGQGDGTIPPGCVLAATFASVRCRLAALAPVVSAAATDPVRGKLTRLLDRAGAFVVKAEVQTTAGRARAARTALRKAIARLRRFHRKVDGRKSGLSDLDRNAIGTQADYLDVDLTTLRDS